MTNVAGYREVLSNSTTRRLLLASVVSTLGDFVGAGALLVLAYDRSGGLAIAGAGLVAATGAGSLTVSLLGGPTLDRLDRRRGLVGAEIVSAAAIVLPLVVTILWPIYIAAFVLGAGRATTVSLRHGVLADAVPERLRSGLLGLMGTSDQAGQVLGYASGAWLAVGLTARLALGLDLITFVVGAIVLTGLSVPPRARGDDHVSVLAGWRAIAGHPQLRLLAVLIAASAAASAMPETLAPLVVGEDSSWLPLVMAAGPAGGVLGFVVAGRLHSTTLFGGQLVHLSMYGAVVALGTVVAGPVGFTLVNVGAGAGAAWLIGPQVTFIRLAPTQHIAQISASMLALVMLSEGGWILLGGAVADRFGVATAYGAGSIVVLAAAIVGWGVHLRRGDDRHRWDPDADTAPAAYDIRTPDVTSAVPTTVDRGG